MTATAVPYRSLYAPSRRPSTRSAAHCGPSAAQCGTKGYTRVVSGTAGHRSPPPQPRREGQLQVITRVGQILDLVAHNGRRLRTGDVAAALGIQRSSAHRYLRSLAQTGLLTRGGDSTYVLGPLAARLFSSVMHAGHVITQVAAPHMQQLVEQVHETAALSLWATGGPVVVRTQEPLERDILITVPVGTALPLDSAQGKVFLAYLPDRRLAETLLARFPFDQRPEMDAELERIRQDGLAFARGVQPGIRSMAAPILGEEGTIVATLALFGPEASIPEGADSYMARALTRTAAQVSSSLGYWRPSGHQANPSRRLPRAPSGSTA